MLNKLYSWYGKNVVRGVLAGIVVLAILGIALSVFRGGDAPTDTADDARIVRTASTAELASGGASVSVVGTVEVLDEAEVRSSLSGPLTSVRVSLGDRVSAGTVLATHENGREQASVLQAQGVYEAAIAQAAQSDISADASIEDLERAYSTARNAFRNTFIDADNVFRNTLDPLFSDQNRQILRLEEFSWERRLIRYELDDWGEESLTAPSSEAIAGYLPSADADLERLATFIDEVYQHILSQERQNEHETAQAVINEYKADLSTARATLNAALAELNAAENTIDSTEAAYQRAQVAGSGSTVSLADANVKQALGSLRLAQAALEETLVRSPIAGVVNGVFVKRGDFVATGERVAMVVGSGALEITAHLAKQDRDRIAVGDRVALEGGSEGTVTAIAQAVDPVTQRYEVKISPESDDFENGDVVRITLGDSSVSDDSPLSVPLTAVKLAADRALVFTVEGETLVAHEVELGDVRGNAVVLTSGATADLVIVTDARGLSEGDRVRVAE